MQRRLCRSRAAAGLRENCRPYRVSAVRPAPRCRRRDPPGAADTRGPPLLHKLGRGVAAESARARRRRSPSRADRESAGCGPPYDRRPSERPSTVEQRPSYAQIARGGLNFNGGDQPPRATTGWFVGALRRAPATPRMRRRCQLEGRRCRTLGFCHSLMGGAGGERHGARQRPLSTRCTCEEGTVGDGAVRGSRSPATTSAPSHERCGLLHWAALAYAGDIDGAGSSQDLRGRTRRRLELGVPRRSSTARGGPTLLPGWSTRGWGPRGPERSGAGSDSARPRI